MIARKNINSLGINSRSDREEDSGNDGSGNHRGY